MTRCSPALVLLLLAPVAADAEEWKTPDGNVSVEAPDAARFEKAAQPQTLVFWHARDESLNCGVIALPAPKNVRLERASIEAGFMKELNAQMRNAKLLASTTEVRAGHEVHTMTAQAEQPGGGTVYFTQTICLVRGQGYKALAVGFGRDTRTDPDAVAFIGSFKILVPAPVLHPAAPDGPVGRQPAGDQKQPVERISYNAGQIAGVCLFVALVLWLVRRLSRGGAAPPRRSRRDRDGDEEDE